jgi:hypothetical protein
VLDLRHHSLVALVGEVGALGDHAVETRALEVVKPGARDLLVARDRRDMNRRRSVRQRPLERRAAVRERLAGEIASGLRRLTAELEPDASADEAREDAARVEQEGPGPTRSPGSSPT